MRILFLFGRDPILSYLEILSYLKRKEIAYSMFRIHDQYLILESNLIPTQTIDELGGTVKIGKEVNLGDIPYIIDRMPRKVNYSIQNFDHGEKEEIFKQEFKKRKMKANDITFKISPTEILKKKLIETGSDFVLADGKLFQTVAVSNPKELEKRDLGRPYQDITGAISPRLAKIMINLSQIKDGVLLDPFCGIGGILQEALLMGFDCMGIDSSKEKINAAQENLKWLKTQYNITKTAKVIWGDARKLTSLFKIRVHGIVTEPYLGDLIKSRLSLNEAENRIHELTRIYGPFFKEAYDILENECFLVIILPYFQIKKRKIQVAVDRIKGKFKLTKLNGSVPIEYGANKNKIGREIYIFMK